MSATSATSGSSLALSGLASGLNWTNIVNEMVTVEEAPEQQMTTQENSFNSKGAALTSIGTQLSKLTSDISTLGTPSFFESRTATLSDPSVATASASTGAPLGSYTFDVTQLATDSVQVGSTASAPLNSSNDVSTLVLSSAGFADPVTVGTFTINGDAVTVSTSETLGSLFTAINTATGGAVTASYDHTTDKISLSSSSAISLGSDTDTSNFLQSAELYNNSTGSITSASALGGVNLDVNMDQANLAHTVSDGGSGNGAFTINGVTINFDASTNSVSDILQKINDSNAGVTATYDSLDNRFELSDTSAGNVGISMQDVTGNFLAATGLSSGTLQAGNNLEYSINGGGTLTSQSNKIDASSSGISGLSVTALNTGSTTITVASDTSTISSAISSFVTDYNAVQSYITSQTATTTSTTGAVVPGLFTGNLDVEDIATSLRQMTDATPGSASNTQGFENLDEIGVESNGTDNTLALNTTTLQTALTSNLTAVQNLFTHSTDGLATTLQSYLGTNTSITGVLGVTGVLNTDETDDSNQSKSIATSITNLQQRISDNETELDNQFTAMEDAISKINTEKQYLTAYFSSSAASAAPAAQGSSDGATSS